MSAKQLGADKRVAMWQSDSQVGMVILQPPPIAKLDHEVKWIESKGATLIRLQSQQEEREHEPEETPYETEESHEVPSEQEVSSADQREWEEEERKAEK